MVGFEQAFSDTERAAEAARKSAANVVLQARALTKAAQSGNIAGIKRGQEKLAETLTELRREVSNVTSCWPFTDEAEEKRHLEERYAGELREVAAENNLKVYEQDGRLIAYPSIVRMLPADRSVTVNGKRVPTIRPSYLVDLLLKNQKKSSSFPPERFLETLYFVYTDIAKNPSAGLAQGGGGRVIPLARIYKLMTAFPGLSRDYDRTDFARDLYVLDSEEVRRTKTGAMVSFPSSTGTKTRKRSSDLFSFVGPDGESVEYYGIRFDENGE